MILESIPVIGDIISKTIGIIDKSVSNKDLATKLKAELITTAMTHEYSLDEKRGDVIITEMKGDSWLQRSWRPIMMLTIVAIVFNNYLLFPYLRLFTDKVVMLALPDELFTLLTVGVGGYIVGRSGEKMVQEWKK